MGEQRGLYSTVRRMWPVRDRVREQDLAPSSPVAQQALVDALDSVSESISSAGSVHGVMTAIVVRGARDTHLQERWSPHFAKIADDVFRDGCPLCDIDKERGAWLLAGEDRLPACALHPARDAHRHPGSGDRVHLEGTLLTAAANLLPPSLSDGGY